MNGTPSRLGLWIGLTRPRTLLSGLSPVLVAMAYAYSMLGTIDILRSILLILIAVSAQVGSNIANDLLDYRKGADTKERKGPLRPLSHGLISVDEVKLALGISIAVLVVSGIAVMAFSSWHLAWVGLFVVLGLFAYSGGPFPLSYKGLGDVAVLVYFGWVPVVVSYFVLTGLSIADATLWHLATAIGLSSINILLVNNYRDYEEDKSVGKRTLIVRLGRDFAPKMYLSCGLLSMLLLYPIYSAWGFVLMLVYGSSMLRAYKHLTSHSGTELNTTLALTARNVFFLALTIILMLLFSPN